MSDNISSAEGPTKAKSPFTEEDHRLGNRTYAYMAILCVTAIVICLGMAFYVFQAVPLDTVVSYDGRYARNGLPVVIGMLLPLSIPLSFVRISFRKGPHPMRKGSRRGVYIFGTALILVSVWAAWVLAQASLVAGGAISG